MGYSYVGVQWSKNFQPPPLLLVRNNTLKIEGPPDVSYGSDEQPGEREYHCIWYDSRRCYVDDMEAGKILPLSKTHLQSFMDQISKLLQGSSNRFFIRNG